MNAILIYIMNERLIIRKVIDTKEMPNRSSVKIRRSNCLCFTDQFFCIDSKFGKVHAK